MDPLNRRLISAKKPDVTVQIALLAKSKEIKNLLERRGLPVETLDEVSTEQNITVLPAHKLSVRRVTCKPIILICIAYDNEPYRIIQTIERFQLSTVRPFTPISVATRKPA